jgi:hypothetical protein
MVKYALPVALLYITATTAALALPVSTLPQLTSPTDVVQVASKSKGKSKGHSHHYHHHHYHGKYRYHGKYYGHRYSHRPHSIIGCMAAGPIWYCP